MKRKETNPLHPIVFPTDWRWKKYNHLRFLWHTPNQTAIQQEVKHALEVGDISILYALIKNPHTPISELFLIAERVAGGLGMEHLWTAICANRRFQDEFLNLNKKEGGKKK